MASLSLREQIQGSAHGRILQEFVTNTAVYPLFDAIRVISSEGISSYLKDLPHYFILGASCVQAWFLGRKSSLPWQQRMLGNLIAPTLYTLIDMVIEGVGAFWSQPYHWLYWIFSLGMALLSIFAGESAKRQVPVIILTNLWRVLLFPAIYAMSELSKELNLVSWPDFYNYWMGTSAHLFIFLAALLFGLLLGLREVQSVGYLALLRQIASKLKIVSEWSLSPDMLAAAVQEDESVALRRRRVERTVMFMDIRGFTRWSERKDPDDVVKMLNHFYEQAEAIVNVGGGAKPHFIADEVLTWFADPRQALETAVSLRQSINRQLRPYNLAVGIGLHTGKVVEGLLGSASTRQFDIIGDTVNTASRLMAAAGPGEVLASNVVVEAAGWAALEEARMVQAKGKQRPLRAFLLS